MGGTEVRLKGSCRSLELRFSASDPHHRSIGEDNLSNMRELIRSLALYPVTQRQVCTVEEFEALVEVAGQELGNISARPYIRLYAPFHLADRASG